MPSSYSTRHLTAGSGVSRSVLLLVALLGLSRVWACSAQQVAETGQTAVTQYSAICVVAKNENRYIREWVEYHKCLGIDHIYLYDHNSATPLSEQVADHIQAGYVTYHDNIGNLNHTKFESGFSSNYDRFITTIQGQVYKDCLQRYGSRHTFVGFIDTDEFVVLHDTNITNFNGFLHRYEQYGGVSLYWVLLGSSGHIRSPEGWVTHHYRRCTPRAHSANTQFKSFVNTAHRPLMYSPHRAQFESQGVYLVNELSQPIASGRNKNNTHQYAAVYHYATRSKADFLSKLRRGGGAGVTRPRHYMRRLDQWCTEVCDEAVDTYKRMCAARGLPSKMDTGPPVQATQGQAKA